MILTLQQIKEKLQTTEYDFLRTNPHLGSQISLLTLGGSYAYGTNNENSDVDVRGFAMDSKDDILSGEHFDQVIDNPTDTTIYSFNKVVNLWSNCNPNTIELLGNAPEKYFILDRIGKECIDNKELFLSCRAANTFGGYANAQLQRLNNKAVRDVPQPEQEEHILNTILYAGDLFAKYGIPEGAIKLFIDDSDNEDLEKEIYADIRLDHISLRGFHSAWSEMGSILRSYNKIGKRNSHATEHGKLGKHMMHLVRLYYMAFDILEKHEINTYRDAEHDMLLDIRNGAYLDENNQPVPEFFELVNKMEKRLEYDKHNTDLPSKPNYKEIKEFKMAMRQSVL